MNNSKSQKLDKITISFITAIVILGTVLTTTQACNRPINTSPYIKGPFEARLYGRGDLLVVTSVSPDTIEVAYWTPDSAIVHMEEGHMVAGPDSLKVGEDR